MNNDSIKIIHKYLEVHKSEKSFPERINHILNVANAMDKVIPLFNNSPFYDEFQILPVVQGNSSLQNAIVTGINNSISKIKGELWRDRFQFIQGMTHFLNGNLNPYLFAVAATSFRWFVGFLSSELYNSEHHKICGINVLQNKVVAPDEITKAKLYKKIDSWYDAKNLPKETLSVIQKVKTLEELYKSSTHLYVNLEIISISSKGELKITKLITKEESGGLKKMNVKLMTITHHGERMWFPLCPKLEWNS